MPRDPRSPQFIWIGAARDHSGHADELRGFLRAQERAGDEPALKEVAWTKATSLCADDVAMLRRQTQRSVRKIDIAVHTYLPLPGSPVYGSAVQVARIMFETDRLPQSWLAALLERDELWVPCRQNLEVFADSGIPPEKMRIIGETLDFDLFAPTATPYPLEVDPERLVFLTNFDFSARKGWETLLRAWAHAFSDADPVCLVLKTGSFYRRSGYLEGRIQAFLREELAARRSALAPIYLLTDVLAADDMPRLYAAADAYVLASRGEGWGRPYMEAQAMGLPTVASNYGGQLEFMDADTSWLVDGKLIDIPDDAELFNDLYRGHRWFDPDVEDLAAKLRDIARDPNAARKRAAPARQRLIERFGDQAMADALREAAMAAVDRYGDRSRPNVTIRGQFGSSASLATVNDGLSAGLEACGLAVHHRAPGRDGHRECGPGISHSWPHDFDPVTAGPTITVVPWEYGAPPRAWVQAARAKSDRVWVPSAFVRERFIAGGMPPGIVEVVPNGFDPRRFTPDGPRLELPVRASCVFLFVGGTIWRKGIDLLMSAWADAFCADDDVALVIKDFGTDTWYRGQTAHSALRAFAARRDIATVHYLNDDLPARELPALYRAADVLVAPYRGEGFCLPALEAMACGLPVIHNGAGPTREFVPVECGWALPADEVALPESFDMFELNGEATVHEVRGDALVAALRDAAGGADRRRDRARAAVQAAGNMTWRAVAARARESLDLLAAEALPFAREACPESVEVEPDRALVVYAPDWDAEADWVTTLVLWANVFSDADPITLALACRDRDADELGAFIMDRLRTCDIDFDSVPDLLLCRSSIRVHDLVARADAVLANDRDRARPELVRRALRVIPAERASLEAYAAQALGEVTLSSAAA